MISCRHALYLEGLSIDKLSACCIYKEPTKGTQLTMKLYARGKTAMKAYFRRLQMSSALKHLSAWVTHIHSFHFTVLQDIDTSKHHATITTYNFCLSIKKYEQTRSPYFVSFLNCSGSPRIQAMLPFPILLSPALKLSLASCQKTKGIVVLLNCVYEPSSQVNMVAALRTTTSTLASFIYIQRSASWSMWHICKSENTPSEWLRHFLAAKTKMLGNSGPAAKRASNWPGSPGICSLASNGWKGRLKIPLETKNRDAVKLRESLSLQPLLP